MPWPPRLGDIRPPKPSTIFYLAVAIFASAPAWIVRHPPLQDLPFHIATIRVLHDYGDPALHFSDVYDLNFHTAYVGYYLVGSLLAYVLGAYKANIALMVLCLGGTPLALRELLIALKKDERLCLFAIPLGVNAMFMMGLLPFVIGLPFMFLVMALAVRDLERPTRKRGVWLGVLGFLLFFTHVVPFALFAITYVALFPWLHPRKWVRAALPMIPAFLLSVWWLKSNNPSGSARGGSSHDLFMAPPLEQSFQTLLQWSTNIFSDQSDEKWLLSLIIAALVAVGLSQGDRDPSSPLSRRFVVVILVCVFGFVGLSDHLGDIWLLAQRFPVPGMLLAIPLLRIPNGAVRGAIATGGILAVCIGSVLNVCTHFIKFEREEVGDFDAAIEAMEPGKHVVGLIYDKSSTVVPNAPFLHFVSYYQLEKGGMVMFSYAHYPHWPFQYKPGQMPPPGIPRLRWEWTPEQTSIREVYPYYDYVLERGNGFHPPPGTYHRIFSEDRWQVWAKDSTAGQN